MSWLQSFRAWWNEFTDASPTQSERLVTAARGMEQALSLHQEATAMTMTRAEEAYERLQRELENNDALQRQAEQFARDNNMDMAQRCITLRLASDERITALKTQYESLRQQAETKIQTFREQKSEVQKRKEDLPQLLRDAKSLEREEELRKLTSPLNPQAPMTAFDNAQRELAIRRKTLENTQLLESDPNRELDRQIRNAIGEKRLKEAMAELQQKVQAPVIDAVFTDRAVGPAEQAKQLLPPSWKITGAGGGKTKDKLRLPPGSQQ